MHARAHRHVHASLVSLEGGGPADCALLIIAHHCSSVLIGAHRCSSLLIIAHHSLVWQAGDPADCALLIKHGNVAVIEQNDTGPTSARLKDGQAGLQAGDFFGTQVRKAPRLCHVHVHGHGHAGHFLGTQVRKAPRL